MQLANQASQILLALAANLALSQSQPLFQIWPLLAPKKPRWRWPKCRLTASKWQSTMGNVTDATHIIQSVVKYEATASSWLA